MTTLERANHFFSHRKYQLAYKLYRSAAYQEKDRALALQGQSECLLRLCKYSEAQKCATEALNLDSNLTRAHLVLAYISIQNQDWDNSMVEVQKVLDLDPDMIEAKGVLSGVLTQQGKKQEAIQICIDLVKEGKANWKIHTQLGYIYQLCGDNKKATAEYWHSLKDKFTFNTLARITSIHALKYRGAYAVISLVFLFISMRFFHLMWAPFILSGIAILLSLLFILGGAGKKAWLAMFIEIIVSALFYLLIYQPIEK